MRTLVVACALAVVAVPARSQEAPQHRVNGQLLDSDTSNALTQFYGPIPNGSYWYDPMSGFWGLEDGPSTGRILPGLQLGGRLQAGASGGGSGNLTGVFVNGREIHPDEYRYLVALFGAVAPGRYWLGPDMSGGIEGFPASFNLYLVAASSTGGAGYNQSTLFGGLMSDGKCSGYLHPSGASVMTGNC